MKILIVMAGFFPGKNYGGPPVSVDNFCSLMKEFQCYIVTRNHDKGSVAPYEDITPKQWTSKGNCMVMYLPDEEYNTNTFMQVFEEIKPDILYLQGLFQTCVYPCLKIAKEKRIKTVLAPRGELCAGAFKKKYKKIPYIQILKICGLLNGVIFQSTSDEETEAINHYLGAKREHIFLTTNIPSIPKKTYLREKKEEGKARFVFISRIHPKKNLILALQSFEHVVGECDFDIYGPIEDDRYWDNCQKIIAEMRKNITVTYCGVLSHDQIAETFCKYDAFVFPTFSENYGHVISESMMSGCIPIISDQTPWTDINDYNAGWAISLSKKEEFVKAINSVISMNDNDIHDFRNNIKQYLNRKIKIEDIHNIYYSMFTN